MLFLYIPPTYSFYNLDEASCCKSMGAKCWTEAGSKNHLEIVHSVDELKENYSDNLVRSPSLCPFVKALQFELWSLNLLPLSTLIFTTSSQSSLSAGYFFFPLWKNKSLAEENFYILPILLSMDISESVPINSLSFFKNDQTFKLLFCMYRIKFNVSYLNTSLLY